MARYVYSEEAIQRKMDQLREEKARREEATRLRKERDAMRRKVNAALYRPQTCLGDPYTGAACTRLAVPGAGMCPEHGGTTKAMQYAAKMRLLALVEPALRVLNKALASHDLYLGVKAAQIILDRSGFHPTATLEIKEQPEDLGALSNEELKQRAQRLLNAMTEQAPVINDLEMQLEPEEEEETPPPPDSVH